MTHRWHWNSLVMLLLLQSCGDSTGVVDDSGVASVRFTTTDPVTLRQGDAREVAVRIYLAARYGRIEELRGYAEELRAMGYVVEARWLDGGMHGLPTLY